MDQSIVISDEEIDAEITILEEMYKTKKEYLDNLKKPEVRDTIATSMQNRKVMEWLKEQVLGTSSTQDKKK